MNCSQCEPMLIDLLDDEAGSDALSSARQHVAGCGSCGRSLDTMRAALGLAEALPVYEPPQAVSARLLQLAEQHAGAGLPVVAANASGAAAEPSRSLWQSWLTFIGRFTMAPQVGMVTITMLVVAVGLWSVPKLSREPTVAGGTVINPEIGSEAAPSAGVEPAAPLDLQVDLNRARIRRKGDLAAAPPAAVEAVIERPEPADEEATEALDHGLAARPARGAGEADELDLDNLEDVFAPAKGAEAMASAGSPEVQGRGSLGNAEGETAAQALTDTAGVADAPAAVAEPAPREAEGFAPAPKARAAAPTRVHKSKRASAAASDPVALATRARAAASSGGCSAALPLYRQALQGGLPSDLEGALLIELAACQQQLGRIDSARALLLRARNIPSAAARARAALQALPAETPATQE